jgi:outer membrane murein-binding lipoprotein Lpp
MDIIEGDSFYVAGKVVGNKKNRRISMKKLLATLFVVAIATMIVGCGNTSRFNETNTEIAVEIINATDAYLDGNMNALEAMSTIYAEKGNIVQADTHGITLSSSALLIAMELRSASLSDEYDAELIVSLRNAIAGLAGERTR